MGVLVLHVGTRIFMAHFLFLSARKRHKNLNAIDSWHIRLQQAMGLNFRRIYGLMIILSEMLSDTDFI
jgi:hypothetical protein